MKKRSRDDQSQALEEEKNKKPKKEEDHAAAENFSQSLLDLALPMLSQLVNPDKEKEKEKTSQEQEQEQYSQLSFDLYAPASPEDDKKQQETKQKEAKKAYQAIFEEQQKVHDFWWKKELQHAAGKIIQGINHTLTDAGAPAVPYFESLSYKISYRGKTYEFDPYSHDSVLIGTKRGCDIPLDGTSNPQLSRLHAAIYFIPTHGSVVLLDMGSTNGLTRKFDTTQEQTMGTVFLLKWKEKARFRLRGDDEGVELILGF